MLRMKSVKYLSFIVVLTFLISSKCYAQTNRAATQSSLNNGDRITICNLIYGGNVDAVSEDAPVVLFIDDSVSHQKIQLVFLKRVRKKFSYDPEKKLPDHRACVSGRITEENNTPAIIIKSERQIKTDF
jgi:preprotein translocase subunit YajC